MAKEGIRLIKHFQLLFFCFLFLQCGSKDPSPPQAKKVTSTTAISTSTSNQKQNLSDYGFFEGKLADLLPSENVLPYTLNTPLFTNYAFKKRFIYFPQGKPMTYKEKGVFDFENGTVLIKNFYYPVDFRLPEGEKRILETRLLLKENEEWIPLNYVWNEDQDEASLNYIGKKTEIDWIHTDGTPKTITYNVPNNNQCKNCHLNGKEISPIGPTAAQLNGNFKALFESLNQLDFYTQHGYLKDKPQNSTLPQFAVWDDPQTGSLEDRAKAYLDINCAHCHQPQGSAKNSGLDLSFYQTEARKRGIFKPPVAAGKGSGDLEYSIVPGHPENSILLYRMMSNDPGIMMPEVGRSVVHEEGVALISEYIAGLIQNK
mgnify:CR=1 FL=1|jgi:uncharacterized repeat protein (TIGR03806 family)